MSNPETDSRLTERGPKIRGALQNYRLVAVQCEEAVRKAREAQDKAWERVRKALDHDRTLQQPPA